ncbi:MAG: hypothetical protein Q8P91_02305, partial [bacterium]|nr:hypothetical protein [bacterium]
QQAVKLSPNEALYRSELSQTSAGLAVALFDLKREEEAQKFTDFAVAQSDKAVSLSPANVNILRNRANIFYQLSKINPEYMKNAIDTLLTASTKAPTDAKIFYNLGIMLLKVGQVDTGIEILEKTILLKPNYKEAKELLIYILEKIDPNDKTAKEELKKIK